MARQAPCLTICLFSKRGINIMTQDTYHQVYKGDTDMGATTYKRTVVTKTASYTLTTEDTGKLFLVNGSGTVVFTLPSTAIGLEFTIQVMQLPGSGVGTSFSPATVDKIIGNGFTAADD